MQMAFYQQYRTFVTIDDFDVDNVVFDRPRDEKVGNSKHAKAKRIRIGYRQDGKIGELIVATEKLSAWQGVRVTTPIGSDSEDVVGYNLPISLYRRGDAAGRDRKFVEIFRQIIDRAKDHTVSVRTLLRQPHLEKSMLHKWDSLLYEKKNAAGVPLTPFGPTLYAKLMYSREKNVLLTKLVDKYGAPLAVNDVIGRPCDVIACVKFDSIYSNPNGCSLQVNVPEAILDLHTKPGTAAVLEK